MRAEYLGLILGLWYTGAAYLTGYMGLMKAVIVGASVYLAVVLLDIALEEYVDREIERRVEEGQIND